MMDAHRGTGWSMKNSSDCLVGDDALLATYSVDERHGCTTVLGSAVRLLPAKRPKQSLSSTSKCPYS